MLLLLPCKCYDTSRTIPPRFNAIYIRRQLLHTPTGQCHIASEANAMYPQILSNFQNIKQVAASSFSGFTTPAFPANEHFFNIPVNN